MVTEYQVVNSNVYILFRNIIKSQKS